MVWPWGVWANESATLPRECVQCRRPVRRPLEQARQTESGDSRGRAFGIHLRMRICRTDTGDPCYADYDLPRSAYMRCAW